MIEITCLSASWWDKFLEYVKARPHLMWEEMAWAMLDEHLCMCFQKSKAKDGFRFGTSLREGVMMIVARARKELQCRENTESPNREQTSNNHPEAGGEPSDIGSSPSVEQIVKEQSALVELSRRARRRKSTSKSKSIAETETT